LGAVNRRLGRILARSPSTRDKENGLAKGSSEGGGFHRQEESSPKITPHGESGRSLLASSPRGRVTKKTIEILTRTRALISAGRRERSWEQGVYGLDAGLWNGRHQSHHMLGSIVAQQSIHEMARSSSDLHWQP